MVPRNFQGSGVLLEDNGRAGDDGVSSDYRGHSCYQQEHGCLAKSMMNDGEQNQELSMRFLQRSLSRTCR